MAMPALVLVHGGGFAADCWEPTVDAIRRADPELKVLTVDLPGRRGKPGDLVTACIDEWVDSVVADIKSAEFDDNLVI
ncbi:MAG TPA: alpha/beta hydrolase, partial [Mycobacterium sp.]